MDRQCSYCGSAWDERFLVEDFYHDGGTISIDMLCETCSVSVVETFNIESNQEYYDDEGYPECRPPAEARRILPGTDIDEAMALIAKSWSYEAQKAIWEISVNICVQR